MKDIETLIANLSHEAAPQRAPQRLARSFLSWLVIAFVYGGLLVAIMWKPRPDLMIKLGQPLFLFEIIALILLSVSCGFSATLLSFPDLYQKKQLAYAPLFVIPLFVGSIVLEFLADDPPAPKPAHTFECCTAITIAALPLAFWMLARIRRMAPTQPTLTGATALLASFGISALALRLSEQTDSIRHIILWHYLPMIGMGVLGLGLGRKFLKW